MIKLPNEFETLYRAASKRPKRGPAWALEIHTCPDSGAVVAYLSDPHTSIRAVTDLVQSDVSGTIRKGGANLEYVPGTVRAPALWARLGAPKPAEIETCGLNPAVVARVVCALPAGMYQWVFTGKHTPVHIVGGGESTRNYRALIMPMAI